MRSATKSIGLAAACVLAAACHSKPKAQDENIAMANAAGDNTMLGNADIVELPADESSGVSSNELEAGSDNPDVNDLNATANSQ
jgi:hypothetical protein